jgi:hypothetical protein
MQTLKLFGIAALLLLGLSACGVQENPTSETQSPKVLPPDPGAAGRLTVEGIDSDEDGVRDDVQIFIDSTWADPATRAACTQLSKAFQDFLIAGSDQPTALAAAVSLNQAIDCVYAVDPGDFGGIVDRVEAVLVNTELRTRAYVRAGAVISGGSFAVSTIADNAASCREAP